MSKLSKDNPQQSVSCGFFNSILVDGEADRLYDAIDMSSLFDGLINDGVFESIGDTLVVTAGSGNVVRVGTGKCWFNNTWTLNDAPLDIDCGNPPTNRSRIDAIVVEVNNSDEVRDNSIIVVFGEESTSPSKPSLATGNERVHRYALAYVTRKAGASEITQSDIENAVGTAETPFVTGIVQVTSLDALLGQWTDQLDRYIAAGEVKMDNFIAGEETDFTTWYAGMKQLMADVTVELNAWSTAEKNAIMTWFDDIKGQLSEDPALNLQIQIDANEIERFLVDGLSDGTKTFSEDGTVIKTVDSEGRVFTKTFTDNFLTITSVLKDSEDIEYLSYPYSAFGSSNTVTKSGITFTNNGDRTITVNGTATSDLYFIISESSFTLDPRAYSLSGCPVGGSEETYYFGADLYNGATYVSNSTEKDVGYGATLDLTDKEYTKVNAFIAIKSGVTMNNIIFDPSIMTKGLELGRLVKKISEDGNTIKSTLTTVFDDTSEGLDTVIETENSYIGDEAGLYTIPSLNVIDDKLDNIISNENSYIEEDDKS